MKNVKRLLVSTMLLGSLTFAVAAIAGECANKGHGKHGFGHDGQRIEKWLDLSDAQKASLDNQREATAAERRALHEKIKAARTALTQAVESGANNAELAALAESLGKLHAEQALTNAKSRVAFMAVLTDEQKKKFSELKAKRDERRKARDAREQHQGSPKA